MLKRGSMKYISFICDADGELNFRLNEYAENGWVLFGFEVMVRTGPHGDGIPKAVVVMVKHEYAEEEVADEGPGAMPMKG